MKTLIKMLIAVVLFASIDPGIFVYADSNLSSTDNKLKSSINQSDGQSESIAYKVSEINNYRSKQQDPNKALSLKERDQYIKKNFSPIMKQLLSYFLPEEFALLTDAQKLEVIQWDENHVNTIIGKLSVKEKDQLGKIVPAAIQNFNFVKNRADYIKEYDTTLEMSFAEKSISSNSYFKNNISSTNPFLVNEFNSQYNYAVQTDNLVDPLYRTANHIVTDIQLTGKHGLGFTLNRKYNSMFSKVLTPEYEVSNGNVGKVPSNAEINGFIATGWTLNIPNMQIASQIAEIKPEIVTCSEIKNPCADSPNSNIPISGFLTKYALQSTEVEKIVFTLENGESIEFHDGVPYQYPYQNVVMTKEHSNYKLTVNEDITYTFNQAGRIISKENRYGDIVLFNYNEYGKDGNDNINILDSYQRKITIFRKRDLNFIGSPLIISGFKVMDGTSVVKDIKYDVSRAAANISYRTWSDVTGTAQLSENPNLGYWQLERVIDQTSAAKILESYNYYAVDSTKLADFNFKSNDYAYSSNADGTPVAYEPNQCADPSKLCYSNQWLWNSDGQFVESDSVVQVNNFQYGEIAYLLLKNINYFNGLTVKFNYQNYNASWATNKEYTQKEQYRGSTRLYTDANALTYFGYHAVDRVDYIYQENNGTKLLSDYYANKHLDHGWQFNEYWKNSKQNIPRLLNSSRFGDKQTIVTQNQVSNLQNLSYKQYIYEPGGINFVLKFAWVSPEGYNPLDFSDQGVHYSNRKNIITSYDYVQGTEQPSVVWSYADDVNDIQRPPTPSQTSIKEVYSYDDWGLVNSYSDHIGNLITYVYGGPQHQLSKQTTTSVDQQQEVVQELSYYSSNDPETYKRDQLKKTIITQKYKDPLNPSQTKSGSQIIEYKLYDKDRNVLQTMESASGDQFESLPPITERNYTYTTVGQIEKEIVKARRLSGTYLYDLTTEFKYDLLGNITRITNPIYDYNDYKYDHLGRVISSNFKNSRLTSLFYDDLNRKVTITLPDGEVQTIHYTPFGLAIKGEQLKSGASRVTFVNQTSDGQLIDAEQPFGESSLQTTYTYDSLGRKKTVTDSLNQTTSYLYANIAIGADAQLQETMEIQYPDGKIETQYYNKYGQLNKLIEKTQDQIRTTINTVSAFGDVTKEQIIAQDNGLPNQNITTEFGYDSNHQLIYLKDNLGQQHQYAYDHNGNLLTYYLNGKKQTEKTYNEIGWLMSSLDASNNRESYEYDGIGLRTKFTDKKGQITNYTYTNLNELETVKTSYKNNKIYETSYAYDTLTRELIGLTSTEFGVQNKIESISYNYDLWKRMDSQTVAGRTYQLGYDNWDRLTSITFPDSQVQSISYDNLNRIDSVQSANSGLITYDYLVEPNNNSYKINYPNNTSQIIQRDGFGELASVSHQNGSSPIFNETFAYDGLGNIIEKNTSKGESFSVDRFKYDALNRLIQEDIKQGQIQYVYDERGNRQQKHTSFEEVPLTNQSVYSYNGINMLNGYLNQQEGNQYSYTYYGDGLRATKTSGNEGTRYVYLNGNIIEELSLDQVGNVTGVRARNIWGNELLHREDYNSSKSGYYMYNGHGDVVQINDASGNLLNSYEYDTWGTITSKLESMSNPFTYTGEYYDEESGLYYLRARYYDPVDARFISEDTYEGTLNNPLSLNLYTYVENNPLKYIDPTGHFSWDPSQVTEIRYVLNDARDKIASDKEGKYYQVAKDFIWDRYDFESYMDTNQYNYLFGLLTGTSAYTNNEGRSDWAREQLVSAYYESIEAEYIALLGMGLAGGLGGGSNIKITSKTFGKPIETTINGKKVKLRVDAEPDGNKIQIQAGGGKNSTVDVRIDPKLPLESQVPKQLNLTKGQKQELLKNLQKAVDWLNN
ncbi:RHS repeat-associated core domain-containing protein [Paenibacillus sp. Marseille-P2973]|uniref:RHS repeat domain-containing protein n=1 Tax=Paenibacillus sp. Marseille-P2973 TaxID=1871032 RepID=UPI001B376E7D|nr:RHS repeat-associated core domain-containing protein [Paenibacillus sp. Marseille-P2973]MBQ4900934.1 RHS repeat-associated core domain-containing protein [Paenibacillus sp. Marseille-P2973]